MAIDVATFEFVCNTGTGNQTIASGLGFTPKGYILFSTQSVANATFEDHTTFLVGMCDGTNQCCVGGTSEDVVAASDSGRYHSSAAVLSISTFADPGSSTRDALATHSSFGSGTIVINWSNAPASAWRVFGIAFGGADFSCEVKAFTTGTTATGNRAYTTTMATPQCAFFLPTISGTSPNSEGANSNPTLGIAISTSKRACLALCSEDARTTMDTWRLLDDTKCMGLLVDSTGAIDYVADFVSWDANGFTLNYTDAPSSASAIFYAMVMKGGNYDMGVVAKRTTTGDTIVTPSGVGTLKGLVLFSDGTTKSATVQSHSRVSIGVASSTSARFCGFSGDTDSVADAICVKYSNNTNVFISATEAATATSSTVTGLADLTAFGVNTFTLNYTTATAATADIVWWVIGENTFTLFERPITESAISVSDTNTRLFMANRSLAESSISVSDTNARMLSAFRTLSEASISVNETLERLRTVPRSISEPSISVSDALERQLIAFRTLSEASISVSETLARMLTAFRIISDPSISVSETLARTVIFPRAINEATISVSETLERTLSAFRTISETSVTVSETLARMLTAFRTISESSIAVSETVVGAKFLIRTINEAVISVSDTLTRVLTAYRVISEASISVSETLDRFRLVLRPINEAAISVSEETLARTLFAFRTLSETSISVSDSIQAVLEGIETRTINEPSISVSETLARTLFAFRTISEPSISVSETVARILTAFRTLSESSISVSETLASNVLALRPINEATISVSETLERILTAFRTISESSISVSETLARTLTYLRPISEPSTSVSETLARMLSAFRVIGESSISVSDSILAEIVTLQTRSITEPSISVSDLLAAIRTFPALANYIVDNGYTNETRIRVTFKSKAGDDAADPDTGDEVIFYQYDSYFTEYRPFNIINWDLRLVQDEISIASMDIEDHAGVITDKNKISFKAVVEIDFKKERGREWQRMMTGFVRRIRTIRPAYNALIYRITVLSKTIVYNERVVNFKRAAKRSAIDSSIPLSTDSQMNANRLFRELHTATDIIPLKGPTIEKTGDFDLDTGSISEEVTDFIAEIAPGLGVASDVARSIGEVTGAIWGTDEFGNPYLRYPTEKHSGIILKDNPIDTDSAWNTSVNMASFEFEDIIDNSEGFANRLYVLNSKDTKSTASSSQGSGNTTLTTRWIAQSFIATDNNISGAAFILSKIGNPTNTAGTIKGYLRASSASGNFPTGSTLATFEISLGSLANSADVIFVNDIKTANGVIIPGSRYWWVLQGTGLFDDTNTVRWHHDNDLSTLDRPPSARLPLVDADPTTPGQQLNWIPSTNGPVYAFSTFSSINHVLTQSDSESIASTGTLVEAVVNLPAFNDDATYQKVLVQLLKNSSKIKRIYEYARVTIPTAKFFLPGELVTLIDSKASLESEKVIHAEIVEVSYTMSSALGCKYADLRMIGFIDPVLDNYLSTHEC